MKYISLHYDKENLDSNSILCNFSHNLQHFQKPSSINRHGQVQILVFNCVQFVACFGLCYIDISPIFKHTSKWEETESQDSRST